MLRISCMDAFDRHARSDVFERPRDLIALGRHYDLFAREIPHNRRELALVADQKTGPVKVSEALRQSPCGLG
jgi:hypothetical protein